MSEQKKPETKNADAESAKKAEAKVAKNAKAEPEKQDERAEAAEKLRSQGLDPSVYGY